MKRCPKCGTDNPLYAKFCRICGKGLETSKPSVYVHLVDAITRIYKEIAYSMEKIFAKSTSEDMFTPDVFPSIQLSPKSICKIRFRILPRLILLMFSSIIFCLFVSFDYEIEHIITEMFGYNYYGRDLAIVGLRIILFLIMVLNVYLCIRQLWKFLKYHINVDYIEEHSFTGTMVRIAKKSKIGLFDNKSKKVCLSTIYSGITLFDDNHILLERDNKVGLYSIKLRKVIVPVKYKSIAPFHNYMTSANIGNKNDYYDIKGNRIR